MTVLLIFPQMLHLRERNKREVMQYWNIQEPGKQQRTTMKDSQAQALVPRISAQGGRLKLPVSLQNTESRGYKH